MQGELHCRLEVVLGDEYENEFGEKFRSKSEIMHEYVQNEKKRINIIRHAEKEHESKKELHEMEVERKKELRMKNKSIREYDGKVSLMKHMFNEIELRACNLEKRCSGSINSWSDSQVFEKRNDIKMIDTEFNEILNKITELVKGTPLEYEEEFGILKTAYKIRNTLRIKKDDYQAELEKEMYDRDLSSEKLQNALLLKIELPKFRGYDSKMDIYIFRMNSRN